MARRSMAWISARDYTLVRLPANLPKAVIERLSKVRVRGQLLNLQASKLPADRAGKKFKPPYRGGKRKD